MKKLSGLILALALTACRAQSPKLEQPLQTLSEAEESAAVQTYDLTPKADIVIVVDYSTSMLIHQENLASNIDKFVDEFKKNTLIDFHIGVLPIYDHVHCTTKMVQNGHQVGDCLPFGELVPLKNADKTAVSGARFVTKDTPNYVEILKNTILLGEQPGPAFEEMFSPIMPALTEPLVSTVNKDFYRSDAHLILIFITDGDDSNGPVSIAPWQLRDDLVNLKGGDGDKVSTVGVLSPSGEACPKDQSAQATNGPKKMEDFIKRTNGKVLSLCSKTFGASLATIGADLSVKVGRQKMVLNASPDLNHEFKVFYGTQEIPQAVAPNYDQGWMYDGKAVYIGTHTVFQEQPGAKLSVKFTPVKLSNAVRGKVQ